MPSEPTPSQVHLQAALAEIAEVCGPPLDGMSLTDWYVITVHHDENGEEVMSRFVRPRQAPWTTAGLIAYAAQLEEAEIFEDEPDDEDAPSK